jgi:hypothetical protein
MEEEYAMNLSKKICILIAFLLFFSTTYAYDGPIWRGPIWKAEFLKYTSRIVVDAPWRVEKNKIPVLLLVKYRKLAG